LRHLTLPTLAALTLMSAAPAHAGSASVSVEHLRFQVIDLDPTDGITASVSLNPFNRVMQIRKGMNGHHGNFNDVAFDMKSGADVYNPVAPTGYTDSDVSGMYQSLGGNPLTSSGWSAKTAAEALNSTATRTSSFSPSRRTWPRPCPNRRTPP
jgi:hypothetical protein